MLPDFRVVILGIVGIINFVFAVLVLLKSQKKDEGKSFGLFTLAVTLWTFGLFMFYLNTDLLASLFWSKSLYFAGNIIPVLFVYFSYAFPQKEEGLALWKTTLIFLPLAGIFYLYYFTDIILIGTFTENGTKGFLYGSFRWAFDIPFSIFFLWGFINLLKKYKKSVGQIRLQLRYMIFSVLAALILAAFTNVILPWFNNFKYLWFGPEATLIIVISITYAIIRYRLMDIRLAIKRGVVFTGSIALTAAVGIMTSLLLERFSQFSTNLTTILGILSSLIIFLPIRGGLGRLSDKYLFAALYSRHSTIQSLSQKLTTIIDLDELTDSVVKTIASALEIEGVAFLLREAKTTAYKLEKVIGFKEDNGLSLIRDTNLINHLQKTAKPLVYEELSGGNLEALKKSMKSLEAKLILPLISKKQLVGIIVLGPKQSGDAYSKEDLNLLETLAVQTSLAIENSRLYDQIKDFNENLESKVRQQTKDITELYKMKSDFLDTASHQLRTPTSIFRGMLSLLGEEGKKQLSPKQKELLQNSIQASDRLNHIIDGIMEANELQGGILKEKFQSVDVEKVIEEAIASEGELAKEKKLAIEFKRSKIKLPSIIGHYAFIKSALQKIINNSLWYTEAGTITIRVSYQEKDKTTAKDDTVSIIVKDTGIGLSPEDKTILFKQFSKGRGAELINVNSSGLGLYIAKRVAELHNGSLTAESEGENQGSTFTLTLPVVQRV